MKIEQIGEKLSKIVNCKVVWDNYTRNFYSVDSSSYILKPKVIVYPQNELDVIKIIKFANRFKISVTPRGAGTGLVGSALGNGIIIDMRNFTKIKLGRDYVQVGSGVFKGHLDKILNQHKKFMGPDPSIGSHCTVGGMIGTNASGMHSLKYGSIIDNLIQVRLVDSCGKIITLPDIYNSRKIIKSIPFNISTEFPKVSKNSCGYRIDKISSKNDSQKIIAGSEGTLGIIVSARLKTYPCPKKALLCIISYKSLLDAARDVTKIIQLKPSAAEIIDNNIIKHIKIKTPTKTGCLLFVEFDNNIQQNKNKIQKIISGNIIKLEQNQNEIKKLWSFRNSALGFSLKSITKDETMPTLIEDAVVPVKRLPLLVKILDIISKKYNLKMIVYGHAGNGNLHIRPILKRKDRHLIKKIASEFFTSIIGIGGSITGEHGDGLARSEFVKLQYGNKVYLVFKNIKNHFDPKNILNPGKIISNQSTVTKNLKI